MRNKRNIADVLNENLSQTQLSYLSKLQADFDKQHCAFDKTKGYNSEVHEPIRSAMTGLPKNKCMHCGAKIKAVWVSV